MNLRRGFYFLIVAAVILGGVELSVRFLKIAPAIQKNGWWVRDRYIPYKAISNSELTHVTDEFKVTYRINSMGFRDVEHTFTKPQGVFRIVAIGDSFTWGQGAESEDTYPYQLEATLNSRPGRHPRIEVINLGICNYFTEPERLALEYYGKQFKPDMVLLGFVRNDVVQTGQGINAYTVSRDGYLMTREADELGGVGDWLYIHSHVCRIVLRRYVLSRIEQRHPLNWDQLCIPGGAHESDWLKVEGEFGKIKEICRAINSSLVVMSIPEPNYQFCIYAPTRVRNWCVENGVDFFDSAHAINDGERDGSLFWEHDPHLKPQGYRIVGRALAGYLDENKLVP